MATVRFSRELQSDIVSRAKRLFTDRIEMANNAINPTWGWRIYHAALGAYKATAMALPEGYCDVATSVCVTRVVRYRGMTFPGPSKSLDFILPDGDPGNAEYLPVPANNIDHTLMGLSTGGRWAYGLSIDAADPRWAGIADELYTYAAEVAAAETAQQHFVEGVSKIMTTYTTLAPALKAWPPLWDLLSEEVRDTHRRVVSRPKKEGPSIDFDTEAMTVAVTIAKILK